MVSEIKYYSFKEIRFHHRHPFPVLLGLIMVIYLVVGQPEVMLFLGIASYALSGPVGVVVRWAAGRRRPSPPPTAEEGAARVRQVRLDKPGQHR
jgi:CDP-diacylglycerol--serine O-phosphatidyltransferase